MACIHSLALLAATLLGHLDWDCRSSAGCEPSDNAVCSVVGLTLFVVVSTLSSMFLIQFILMGKDVSLDA